MDPLDKKAGDTAGPVSDVVSTRRSYGRNRTYFFDVKRSAYGRHFLTISESKQKDGEFVRHRLLVNGGDLRRFSEVLQQCAEEVFELDKAPNSARGVRELGAPYVTA